MPGNSQTAIEQMCFCFVLFLYELPIFAIQDFVNNANQLYRFITSF